MIPTGDQKCPLRQVKIFSALHLCSFFTLIFYPHNDTYVLYVDECVRVYVYAKHTHMCIHFHTPFCCVMLCYVMSCYVMLRSVVSCYVTLCHVMLCYVLLCCVMLRSVVLCYVTLCCVVLCCLVLCSVV